MEFDRLFSSTVVGGLELKNRLAMAPLYPGYSGEGGTVSQLQLDRYRLMAQSGVDVVAVENDYIAACDCRPNAFLWELYEPADVVKTIPEPERGNE